MDYPKSVPGVGLVDGKFVDENQAAGQVGSLIPSAWGNAVTDEILDVIVAGGEEPNEGRTNQLRLGILGILKSAAAKATEILRGTMRLATQAEVNAGVVDDAAVTPKKLRLGISFSFGNTGYVFFPTWFLNGFCIQWGYVTVNGSAATKFTFPVAFPTECCGVNGCDYQFGMTEGAITAPGAGGVNSPVVCILDRFSFVYGLQCNNTAPQAATYVAWGH